jgi:hypothetical protein
MKGVMWNQAFLNVCNLVHWNKGLGVEKGVEGVLDAQLIVE